MNVFLEQILHIVSVDRLRYKEMMLIILCWPRAFYVAECF